MNENLKLFREGNRLEAKAAQGGLPSSLCQDKPIYLNGNAFAFSYRRNGEGDYRCSEDEVRGMIRASGSASQSTSLTEAPIKAALNAGTFDSYRKALEASRPGHPWAGLAEDDLLLRLEAAARPPQSNELVLTEAGLLMFGHPWEITRHFPYYFLEYREVSTGRKWDERFTSADADWEGNLFEFWLRVSTILQRDLPQPYETSGMYRTASTPMHEAVREALANALIHADYHGNASTIVTRSGKRLTLTNPGVPLLGVPEMMAGGLSQTRNPSIMKMFNLVGIGERAGSGFDTMRRACRWAHVSDPRANEALSPDRTTLELALPADTAPIGRERAGSGRETKPNQDVLAESHLSAIMELAASRGSITRAEVENAVGLGRTASAAALRDLVRQGQLERTGKGRSTAYRLS